MASSIKRRSKRLALVIAVAVSAAGCELIVDFDRTKIDGGGGDGSVLPDVTTQDVAKDTNTGDVAKDVQQQGDSGADASDAANDVANDASDGALDDGADASDGATE